MPARSTVLMCAGLLLAAAARPVSGAEPIRSVAVFPLENLSGGTVPPVGIREFLVDRLVAEGVTVLADDALGAFMTRHRLRYVGGVDAATADALRRETGVDGVVIASVELSSQLAPPKIALAARLVSVQAEPTVVWGDDAGLAGDAAPGLLDLGMVYDQGVLWTRALTRIGTSLVTYLKTGLVDPRPKRDEKFRPRVAYQAMQLEPGKVYSVAVLPFFNGSRRRNAGELLALLFMRHLADFEGVRVIDSGEVRQQLLRARVIMDGGVSLSDADLVASILEADFVLGGRVLYYDDYEGADANPRVDFTTVLIERTTRRVVWSSHSYREGGEGVRFFGLGRTATAHAMATQMVRLVAERLAGPAGR